MILRKIGKFDATRCQILRLKCTKFDFRYGSATDPTGELTAPPVPQLYLRGLLLWGVREGEVEGMERDGKGFAGLASVKMLRTRVWVFLYSWV